MTHAAIFYPVLTLACWTLLVLIFVPVVRIRAAMRGEIAADDFRYGESSKVPQQLSLPNRNYMNLLELPTLFYLACLIAYITNSVSPIMVMLAWCFVALRLVHSAIHLSYNNVLHRLIVFALGSVVLAVQLILTMLALHGA
jgi:hypothetical protein